MRVLLAVAAAIALGASSGQAQVCGDPDDSFSITTTDAGNPMRIKPWSRTKLLHGGYHPDCAVVVGVRSELWFDGSYTGCMAGPSHNGVPTATNSSAYHDRESWRWCTMYHCGPYEARGRHYFDGAIYWSTEGNVMPGGDCGGGTCNPCTPGYVPGDNCDANHKDVCGCCPDPCPLVIDRSGDGLSFSGADDGALFDINGYRAMFWLGWPKSADDAWLAYDRNGNGTIDNGSELFGNTRRLASGRNAEHGYEVLAELDEDGSGVVDAADPVFAKLLLWGDANRNGVSEPKELVPLASTGIKSLAVEYRKSDKTDVWGNRFRFIAVDRSSIDVFPVWDVPDSSKPGKR